MTIAIYRSVQEEAENAHQAERRFSVSGVLSELDVSSSGYYDWAARKPSKQAQHRKEMKKKIQTIYDDSKQIYGAPKIAQVMQQNGDSISERTVGVYMRQMGIQACWVKHYTVTTRNSDFDVALVNILQECFNPEEPDQVWCSDITYIWTAEGFVYLESIMDLFSRKIIAWNLAVIWTSPASSRCCRKPNNAGNPASYWLSIRTVAASMFRKHTLRKQPRCAAVIRRKAIHGTMPALNPSTP